MIAGDTLWGMRTTLAAASLVAVTSIALAGCATKTDTAAEQKSGVAASTVTVSDQWVKAVPSGMTGLFGTLKNSGDREVTVVSAASPVAGQVELHEVVGQPGGSALMRAKDGGFAIPANGTHILAPGADHVMLMDIKEPLQAGNDVEMTLTFDDGSTLPFTAQVRDFQGANEDYQPGGGTAGARG